MSIATDLNFSDDLKLGTVIKVREGRDAYHNIGPFDPNEPDSYPFFMFDGRRFLEPGKEYVVTQITISTRWGGGVLFAAKDEVEDFLVNPKHTISIHGPIVFCAEQHFKYNFWGGAKYGYHLEPWEKPLKPGKDYSIEGNILEKLSNFEHVISGYASLRKEVCIKKYGEEEIDPEFDRCVVDGVRFAKNRESGLIVPVIDDKGDPYLFDPAGVIPAPPRPEQAARHGRGRIPQRHAG